VNNSLPLRTAREEKGKEKAVMRDVAFKLSHTLDQYELYSGPKFFPDFYLVLRKIFE